MVCSIFKIISFLFSLLPLSVLYAIGRAIGRFYYLVDTRHRKITLGNLDLAYGDEISSAEKKRIAVGCYQNLGISFFEFLSMAWMKPNGFEGYVREVGFEKIDEALKRGKGVIVSTAHFGNWELMAAFIAFRTKPIKVVARKMHYKPFEDFIAWVRTKSGNELIDKKMGMRKILRALNANEIVGILVDQNVTWREGVFVDYFGVEASTNKGPALIAQRTGAAVFPVFNIREGYGYRIEVFDEIKMVDTGDKEADLFTNTQRITKSVEDITRRHPELWFWVHRRWRSRQGGAKTPPRHSAKRANTL